MVEIPRSVWNALRVAGFQAREIDAKLVAFVAVMNQVDDYRKWQGSELHVPTPEYYHENAKQLLQASITQKDIDAALADLRRGPSRATKKAQPPPPTPQAPEASTAAAPKKALEKAPPVAVDTLEIKAREQAPARGDEWIRPIAQGVGAVAGFAVGATTLLSLEATALSCFAPLPTSPLTVPAGVVLAVAAPGIAGAAGGITQKAVSDTLSGHLTTLKEYGEAAFDGATLGYAAALIGGAARGFVAKLSAEPAPAARAPSSIARPVPPQAQRLSASSRQTAPAEDDALDAFLRNGFEQPTTKPLTPPNDTWIFGDLGRGPKPQTMLEDLARLQKTHVNVANDQMTVRPASVILSKASAPAIAAK